MGLSEQNVSDFSLEAQVADLEAVVDDLKLERFALFGISQGGPVAIAYTVRHPERVSHLILFGSFDHWWYMDTEEGQRELEALLTLIRQGWSSDAPAHRVMGNAARLSDFRINGFPFRRAFLFRFADILACRRLVAAAGDKVLNITPGEAPAFACALYYHRV